jgi:hypothetical protein
MIFSENRFVLLRNFAAASMLSCSNSKGCLMEPVQREDHTASDDPATERSVPSTERQAFTAPFASEGLERVRDSHC